MAKKLYDEEGNEVKQQGGSGCLKWFGILLIISFGLSFFVSPESDEATSTANNTNEIETIEPKEETTDEDAYYESIRHEALEESVKQASIDESESISESIEESIKDENTQRNIAEINKGVAEQLAESTNNMAYYIQEIEFDDSWRINANVTADVYTMNEYERDELESLIRGITQNNYYEIMDVDYLKKLSFHMSVYSDENIVAQTSMFDPSNLKWY